MNVYRKARLKAAKTNYAFGTLEGARLELCFTKKKLMGIEQTDSKKQITPKPEEVDIMMNAYNAPELRDYYCTHQCPLGAGRPPLNHENLGEISTALMAAIHFLGNDNIYSILEDSKVSDEERNEFARVMKSLRSIAHSINSLELWAQKNGYEIKE